MPEKIKLTFLGTGSAIPTKKHNHPSMLLQYKDENILIDCGEGTQRQFRIKGLNICKLTRILITHWHADHVLGLPGLFQTLMLSNYSKTLNIHGPKGTKKMIDLYLQLFVGAGNRIKIQVQEVEGKFLETKDFFLEAEPMQHNTPANAYSFNIKEKIHLNKEKLKKLKIPNSPLLGELAKGKSVEIAGEKIEGKKLIYKEEGKKITFIMDTLFNQNAIKLAKNSDILVSESTYDKHGEDLAKEHFHLTSEQAAEIAKKSNSKKLILTHLSQKHENNSHEILKEAKKIFKNTVVANDFDEFEL